jgi:putative Mg2+ transporter-C (MgtC) family protein
MDLLEITLRLGAATLAGVALGLNRDLHGKPTGVRTLALVGLGAALIVMAAGPGGSPEASRVIQGVVTGIGFLGAGVIIRNEEGRRVHGLTTAACVWFTACAGAASGAGHWLLVLVGLAFAIAALALGGPFERAVRRWFPHPTDDDSSS